MRLKTLTTITATALIILSSFSGAFAATYEELQKEADRLYDEAEVWLAAADKEKAANGETAEYKELRKTYENTISDADAKQKEADSLRPKGAGSGGSADGTPDPNFNLIVPIPGLLRQVETNPLEYIKGIYNFGIGFGMLIAVAIIVFAGLKWTTSAGNPSAQSEAKDMILNAVFGVVMLLGAILILRTIDPKLTTLSLPTLKPLDKSDFDFGTYSKAYADDMAKLDKEWAEKQQTYAEATEKARAAEKKYNEDKSLANEIAWKNEELNRVHARIVRDDADIKASTTQLHYAQLALAECQNDPFCVENPKKEAVRAAKFALDRDRAKLNEDENLAGRLSEEIKALEAKAKK